MKGYSYNKQQKHRSYCVLLCRIFLAFILIVWLFTHLDITVSNKRLPVFIFINFIIFALCFLSSINQSQTPPYAVYHDNAGTDCDGGPEYSGDSLPEEEEQILEEMLVDTHITLARKAVEGIAAVSSDNFRSSDRNHNQFEVWRLERGMSKELLMTMTSEPPWKSMDEMSNEEFRFAVRAFIADKKKVMMQENIHDDEGYRFIF